MRAEKEMEEEVRDVVSEVCFQPLWYSWSVRSEIAFRARFSLSALL
jgi:hypothetical protein